MIHYWRSYLHRLLHSVHPGSNQSEQDGCSSIGGFKYFTLFFLPANTVQLPMYRGKELLLPISEVGASSSLPLDTEAKSYAWSRGISSELSPLQTRSSRKKKEILSSQQSDPAPSTLDSKALRALKALARSK
jgi:hypothetical protein